MTFKGPLKGLKGLPLPPQNQTVQLLAATEPFEPNRRRAPTEPFEPNRSPWNRTEPNRTGFFMPMGGQDLLTLNPPTPSFPARRRLDNTYPWRLGITKYKQAEGKQHDA